MITLKSSHDTLFIILKLSCIDFSFILQSSFDYLVIILQSYFPARIIKRKFYKLLTTILGLIGNNTDTQFPTLNSNAQKGALIN